MKDKEHYRRNLPHFEQPGQAYFITVNLNDAIPPKALSRYSIQLNKLQDEIKQVKNDKSMTILLPELENKYALLRTKYIKAYDDLLDLDKSSEINLNLPENLKIMFEAFRYYEGKRLENLAFCVMKNHYHWVVSLFEKDENGKPVYLNEILKVVNGFSAYSINKLEMKTGRTVWQDENFETSIRNQRHLYNAVMYTINNPVKAGLVKNWSDWKGTWCSEKFL